MAALHEAKQTDAIHVSGDPFDGGPPLRLQRSPGLVKPGQPRAFKRALLAVLISWVPLAVLAELQHLFVPRQTFASFYSDFAVHARCLIATPALILAEPDCIPRLGMIARHFLDAGLIRDADRQRNEG